MDHDGLRIRVASLQDAEQLLRIYAPYVHKTAVTFEYAVPSLTEFKRRMERTLLRYPYLVAANGREIMGYAYTGAFASRAAYDWSAETSIYIKEENLGCGLGRALYQALDRASAAQNILNLNARIGYPETEDTYLTRSSAQFHAHLGYTMVGEFHKCGYKFGRWYNMVWMEKLLGLHSVGVPPVIPFPALSAQMLASIGIDPPMETTALPE